VVPRPLQKLREMTDAGIIIKQSKTKYRLSIEGEKDLIFVSKFESKEIPHSFMVCLATKIAEGLDIRKSVEFAIGHENELLAT